MEKSELILGMMAGHLTTDQQEKLKQVLNIALTENSQCTALITADDNMYMLQKYCVELKVQQKSERTIKNYYYNTRNFLAAVKKNFRMITGDDVVAYFVQCELAGQSALHMENKRRAVKTFFRYLVETEMIQKDPFMRMKPIKVAEHSKVILTDMEIERMRDECKNLYETALLDFLLSTGLRVGEAETIRWDDFDFDNASCRVLTEKTNEYRTVYLDAKALTHVKAYHKWRQTSKNRGKVFGKARMIESHLHEIAERAKVGKFVSVHTIRRTFASRLFERGMDITLVAKLLGHKSTATTMKYYVKISEDNTKQAFRKAV